MPVKELIQEQIAAGGPIPFEEFMRLALYHPDGGYFADGRLRSEKAGDFLTSPEVSGLFGETLARFVDAERIRIGEPFEVVEVGAGSGSLLRSLLGSLDVVARAVEVSPAAREALTGLLPDGNVTERLPPRVRGVVIANELIDNIPMALAQKAGDVWRERWVGRDGDGLGFVDADVRPEVLAWLESNAGDVGDGGWVEVQLEALAWLGEALGALVSGSVLILDYGDL
ncbi:MAG TPA: SAM-dependent methyltransferase, partial [Acidimicrobiia bacterium]|nr:SAM-dependent methyltransferase [Acidimicrobiia bacterium]